MFKFFLLLIAPFILLSCLTKSQSKIDKAKADKLYKESTPLIKKFLELQIKNNDSANIICKQLIDKFEQIYKADSTDEDVGHYLANFYTIDRQYSKALKWYLEQLRHDTYEPDIAKHNEGAGFCYINIGQFDSAKAYLRIALNINSQDKTLFDIQGTVSRYKKIADNINNQSDSQQIVLLKSKNIIPCQYSIELLNYMLPIAQNYLDKILLPFNADTITLRKKNCR